jgi:hypothetical protein
MCRCVDDCVDVGLGWGKHTNSTEKTFREKTQKKDKLLLTGSNPRQTGLPIDFKHFTHPTKEAIGKNTAVSKKLLCLLPTPFQSDRPEPQTPFPASKYEFNG